MLGGLVLGGLLVIFLSYWCACSLGASPKAVETFVDVPKTAKDPTKRAQEVLSGVQNPQEGDIIESEAVPRFV